MHENFVLFGVALVPMIIGIVEIFKSVISPKYAGILALFIGAVIGIVYGVSVENWGYFKSILIGASLGLTAAGTYSTQKNVRETWGDK